VPTHDIRIVHLGRDALAALAAGDLEGARAASPVPVTAYLVGEECRDVWVVRARQVVDRPEDQPWVTGLVYDVAHGITVGRAGFHGVPDERGMVEVGYSIDPEHRRQGYARAAMQAMVDRARTDPTVRVLRATVSPDNTPSLNLVAGFAMEHVGEQWDEEDGLELVFEMSVESTIDEGALSDAP
jgi:RimJ/RimL family protein N-acetyltransferase